MPLKFNMCAEVITARTNPLLVRIAKLEDKKYREAEKLFRFDGIKLFCEALMEKLPIEYVFLRESSETDVKNVLDKHFDGADITCPGKCVILGDSAFDKISPEKSPEGIICVSKYIDNFHKTVKIYKEVGFSSNEKILLLESVRDPGNLGTVLRSASAFGYDTLVLSADCADIYNSKTLRAAMGAAFRVKTVRVDSIIEVVGTLKGKGRRVFAAALDGSAAKLGEFEVKNDDCFLIGNEGHGLSGEAVSACTRSVFIPMTEGTESLNASVAASVCMWEQSRKGL